MEREAPELPLKTQADLLSLSRSSLYYQPVPVSAEEVATKHAIDEIYTRYPFYGSRRITIELRQSRQIKIARETVQRYMREMGISGICPGPNLSRRNVEHKVYPYLLRNVKALRPNHVWGIDITYIRLRSGWMYLVAVLDWFSRYVVCWELDQTLAMPFVVDTVQRALAQATPVIWNSDQGSHFTSPQYIERLLAAEVRIRDGVGIIVAFYTGPAALDEGELRAYVEGRLARYKQPRAYLHLPALPTGANGKLLRRALPACFEAAKS